MHKFLLIAALVILPAVAHAQKVMKCVGPGRVEYASVCPPGTKAETTGISNNPGAAAATPQKSLAERDADFRKRRMEGEESAKKSDAKAAVDADRKQNCTGAQSYLRSLEAGVRIGKTDPKTGERSFLEDKDRAAEVARAQRAVDTNCK